MRRKAEILGCVLTLALTWMVPVQQLGAASMSDTAAVSSAPFGQTAAGVPVRLYTLRNRQGMEARITNYGGIIVSLTAPDRSGHYADVVLGFDSLAGYLKADNPYFGAMIGRYGNRIARGKFELDGVTYTLATNNGPNSLHGGKVGFDKVVWHVTKAGVYQQPQLKLSYLSQDGEEGYPGNLKVTALYTLTSDNTLRLDYTAVTDKDTPVNLTQHSYFNLRVHGDILGHVLEIPASRFTPVDATLIPVGELRLVSGTPFDFRQPTAIGARIDTADEQLTNGKGYDHNWVLDKPAGKLGLVARVADPESGRVLEISSTEPGVQFYSGNFLDGSNVGKEGKAYARHAGLALEPQHFPDSPNQPSFPSVILKPGQTYRNTIVYKFSAH
jgi:aldose 1-epimerase